MKTYRVQLARSARKDLEKLPASIADRIIEHLETLAKNPRPTGVLKLHGQRGWWRIRVGTYRVIYSIDDSAGIVDVATVQHRRDVYRDL